MSKSNKTQDSSVYNMIWKLAIFFIIIGVAKLAMCVVLKAKEKHGAK